MSDDVKYMKLALEQAQIALTKRNFPCGAVLVDNDIEGGKLIAEAHNEVYIEKNAIKRNKNVAFTGKCQNGLNSGSTHLALIPTVRI